MVQLSTFLASISLFSSAFALPPRISGRHHHKGVAQNATCPGVAAGAGAAATGAKAIYFITNDACNSVVALKVAVDGTLSDGSITSTGGAGMNGLLAATGGVAAPDALFSQGAVKVAGHVRNAHPVILFELLIIISNRTWLLSTRVRILFLCLTSAPLIQLNSQWLARLSAL
jgi:hypothetical protein